MDSHLERRRELRRACTDAEARLWKHLRAKRLGGFKFRRQHSCGPYILDFFCSARRLAVEVDGSQHWAAVGRAYDRRRCAFLAGRGIFVLRFPNDHVLLQTEQVLLQILKALEAPHPSPLPEGEGNSHG